MKKFKVGLQLYSVRDHMEKDMKGTLQAVKDMGYDCVEFAGYFGKSAQDVKAMLDEIGLEAVSVHQAPKLFWEEGQSAIDYLKVLGVKYAMVPSFKVETFQNDWDNTIEKFTELGKTLKENGIQFGYHNHDFEFQKIHGENILDALYAAIDKEYLQAELDTCWVKYGKHDPVEYIKKYSGRVDVLHLKDFIAEDFCEGPVYDLIDEKGKVEAMKQSKRPGFLFRPLGGGVQDFASILEAAEKSGTEYVIVEQDNWYDDDSLDVAKQSRAYLKNTFGI